ncbi:MAG: VWA domain-containing protein [Deltaproteobacteria bacterium]|nr:VWA domain-containing protein [Deltaproteobacteria bacterium]
METVVTRFVQALREEGIRVSPGECLDAVHALALGGVEGREGVRALLQLTLVKNANDIPGFNDIFDIFFSRQPENPFFITPEDLMGAYFHIVEGEEFTAEMLEKREEDRPGLLSGAKDLTAEDLENMDWLRDLEDSDGPEIQVRMKGHKGKNKAPKPSEFNLLNLPSAAFSKSWSKDNNNAFTPEEIADMHEVVSRMLIRIRKDVRRLKEEQNRGKLHVIKTLQKNYRNGMVPFLVSLRRKKKVRPRLVVLCDVSFSVSYASRFMLLLLHTLHNRLMDVRSFVFNQELAEITDLLTNMPVNCLLEIIDSGALVDMDENSDYGKVLVNFKKRHLESMRGNPTVIILGDARNNYNEANDWVMDEIREKAGYLLWLTPEDRETWKRGDCLIEQYGAYCDKVEQVKSVDELSVILEDLFRSIYTDLAPRKRRDRHGQEQDEEPVDYMDYYKQAKAMVSYDKRMQLNPSSAEWRKHFGTFYQKKR